MTLPAPFHTTREYRAAFIRGLSDMLGEEDLGTLILVLANATIDKRVEHILHARLGIRFTDFRTAMADQLQPEKIYPPDDFAVFQKLQAVGFENIRTTQYRKCGPWELQFNQMRSFRPPRVSTQVVEDLHQPFDPDAFHFNKPFLHKEIFWQGDLLGRNGRLLYNKFPFAELHGLLVLDADQEIPQYLRKTDHEYIWTLVERLGQGMQGVGVAYNACGAYASINHQHFQLYVRDGGRYPIEHPHWRHRGGADPYPLACHYLNDHRAAWSIIEDLHRHNQAYNLLYRPGGIYVVPRRMQGSYCHADWAPGFAWAEVMGSVTAYSADDFDRLTAADVEAELAKLTLAHNP